jgi:quinol monooxygenase YgiN
MDYPPEAMFDVRLSLMMPRPGARDEVIEMHQKLIEWLQGQPGFVRAYLIVEGDPHGRVGHLSVYRTMQDADNAAQTDHVLAVRSELLLLIEEDSRAEHEYTAIDPLLAKATKS